MMIMITITRVTTITIIIIVVFGEMGKPEHHEKNLSEENREPTSSIQI